jgi:hypothetical protein
MYKTYNAINKVLTSDKDEDEKSSIISSFTIGLSKIKIGAKSAGKILSAYSKRYDTYDGKTN